VPPTVAGPWHACAPWPLDCLLGVCLLLIFFYNGFNSFNRKSLVLSYNSVTFHFIFGLTVSLHFVYDILCGHLELHQLLLQNQSGWLFCLEFLLQCHHFAWAHANWIHIHFLRHLLTLFFLFLECAVLVWVLDVVCGNAFRLFWLLEHLRDLFQFLFAQAVDHIKDVGLMRFGPSLFRCLGTGGIFGLAAGKLCLGDSGSISHWYTIVLFLSIMKSSKRLSSQRTGWPWRHGAHIWLAKVFVESCPSFLFAGGGSLVEYWRLLAAFTDLTLGVKALRSLRHRLWCLVEFLHGPSLRLRSQQ